MGMVIVNPGIYTTVQDEGRFGYEQFGVSPAGPMDRRSFHIANLLVGNDIGEAELEMTIIGTEIRFTGPAVIALTGADMSPLLNEAPVCMYRAFPVGAGDVLRMQSVSGGCRTYLAAAGGLDIPVVMGSRSTLVKNGIGGYQGRPLKKGDAIGLRQNMSTIENLPARWMLAEHSEPGCRQIRVIAGPQDDCFTGKGLEDFFHGTYKVTAVSYTHLEQNYVPKMLLGQRGGFVQTDFLDAMGKDTEFIYTTGGWSADIDTDTSKQLIELYKQYTPDGADLSEGHCKDMINVLLIALGINQAGTTEPEALNEALRNLEVDTSTLPIPWNAITMDEYGQNTSANAFVLQMRDGKYQTVYPSDYAAIEPVLPMPAWNER